MLSFSCKHNLINGILLIFPVTRKIILSKYSKKYSSKKKSKNVGKNFIEGEFEDIDEDNERKL